MSDQPLKHTLPPRLRRHWPRRVAGGLLAAVMLAELILRWQWGLGNPLLYRADADAIYLPAPNQDVVRFHCRNKINAQGMRCDDVAPTKRPGTLRVMCIGDSVTYGTTYVDQADIFTSRLQRELPPKLGRPVEVLNASAGGWAVFNEVGYLKSRGTFGANEVIFVLNTQDLVQPLAHAQLSLASGFPTYKPPLALWELYVRYIQPRLTRMIVADPGSIADAAPPVDSATPLVLAQLGVAQDIAQQAGAQFAIVFSRSHGPQWQTPAYDHGFDLLRAWADSRHVPLLDLGPAYSASAPQAVYFDGEHLRPRGHEIVAGEIERQWSLLAPSR